MKKLIILSVLALVLPLSVVAQDDLYFTPKKVDKTVKKTKVEPSEYYGGSARDVDEYNRRSLRSYYEVIGVDSLGNDIIDFRAGDGYPADSVFYGKEAVPDFDEDGDFEYSRQLSRWDGFYDPWFYTHYGWHSPWWYGRYGWYDPWYSGWYGWYDPWYYGYTGWYDPWYYGWGWGYPYYGWHRLWHYGGYVGGHHGVAMTQGHGRVVGSGGRGIGNGRSVGYSAGTFGGSRVGSPAGRSQSTRTVTRNGVTRNANGNFGGSRSSGGSTRSMSSGSVRSGGFGGGGSFGGSRSGGGSSGGSRGGFGGRR